MSPEGYIDNIYGPKTDVWAFGLVIYELLHGKAPLAHIGSQEELKKQLKVPIRTDQFRSDLSCELKELLQRCL
jgi:serine/threonine protein kinase